MSDFVISIIERQPVRTVGMSVVSTLANASVDCPHLWSEEFDPRMHEYPLVPDATETSYGVSIMDQSEENAFTYWAVMPVVAGAPIPEGMQGADYSRRHVCKLPDSLTCPAWRSV